MVNKKFVELAVGLMVVAAGVGLFMLAFKVSGLSVYSKANSYHVTADFDNIGDLKVRAPVVVAGVKIGEVDSIQLTPDTFRARVGIRIDSGQNQIPVDSAARILTHGLLGSNYIGLTPGFGDPEGDGGEKFLKDGSAITETQPALILENLIGHLIFNLDNKKEG